MPLVAAAFLSLLLLVADPVEAWGGGGFFWGRATFYDDNTE